MGKHEPNIKEDLNTRVVYTAYVLDGRNSNAWAKIQSRDWWIFCAFSSENILDRLLPLGLAALVAGGPSATFPPMYWDCLTLDLPSGAKVSEVPTDNIQPGQVQKFRS